MVTGGQSAPALDLTHDRYAFFGGRPVLRLFLISFGEFDLLQFWSVDFVETEDVLRPISIVLFG